MTSTYFANTNTKIKKFKGKSCSVQPQSGLPTDEPHLSTADELVRVLGGTIQ